MISRLLALALIASASPAQTRWIPRSPTTSPPARGGHVLAFDEARARVLLFGGGDAAGARSDTWEWDGTTWVERFPAQVPPGRFASAMTYDRARARVVLFGGAPGRMSDTWEWNGVTWSHRLPAKVPPGRDSHALAYDPIRRRTVLYGGVTGAGEGLADTWEWDGDDWTEVRSPTGPGPLAYHLMVFDSVRGRVALFGGGDITRVNDRWWEWDGSRWTRNDVGGPAPSPRFLMGLAHDLSRGRTVVQAGLPGMLSDTWERTTAGWTELTFPPSPGVRAYHALAYDVRRGRTVLFGGTDGLWMPLSDTWELEDPSCRFAGSGHAEARAPWAATSPPRIGTDFCLAFVTPGSGFLVLGTASLQPALPVSPPAFCSPGLLHTFPVVLFPIGAGGSVCLPVPDHQLLPGNRLYVQAGRVETGGCLRLTDALAVTLLP